MGDATLDPAVLLKLARTQMAFGKHKGRLLIDLPKPYEVRYIRKKVNKYSMRVKAPFLISLDGQARHKSGGQVFLEAKEARCIGKHKTVAIIVRANAIKHLTVWVFISLALACLCRCASFGPTSPNPVYQGPYPPKHYELLHKNPPLAQELGKLPEIQDGISDSEASGLEQLFDLYDKEPERFDAAFEQMYAVGKPEVRKFCTPLQALFWLAEDGELHNAAEILASFSLEKLLNTAWHFDVSFHSDLSKEQILTIISGIKNRQEKERHLRAMKFAENSDMQYMILLDFKARPDMFNRNVHAIIRQSLLSRNSLRWDDHKLVIERLNSPELLDHFINHNITYKHRIPCFHRSPRNVITERYGDCDDLAYFGRVLLTRAGYDVFGRIVGVATKKCHIGLGVKLDDESYLLAVHFNQRGNHMSGPYKTILELDQALGYGTRYQQRGSFYFNW